MEPSADKVEALQTIHLEVAPSNLVRGQLPASTLLYLRQFRLGDRRFLGLSPRDVMFPSGPYQSHLRLLWERILAKMAPVTVVTTDEAIVEVNDNAFHRLGDPNYDPFGFFLVDSNWDY